jgi:hypothetical protein
MKDKETRQKLLTDWIDTVSRGDKEGSKKLLVELEAAIPRRCKHDTFLDEPCFHCNPRLKVQFSKHQNYYTVLKMRTLVYDRLYDMKNAILSRMNRAFTMLDQEDKNLILSLCTSPEEQAILENSYAALDFYQQLADKM